MEQLGAPAAAPARRGPPRAKAMVIEWDGVEYMLVTKPNSGGLTFQMFSRVDDALKNPLGEIAINPATGTFKGSAPTFKAVQKPQ
jgi:hypothetical protein